MIFLTIFATPNRGIYLICNGESVAQQVEHNTFNVGVPGSSPGGITERTAIRDGCRFFIHTTSYCRRWREAEIHLPPREDGWVSINRVHDCGAESNAIEPRRDHGKDGNQKWLPFFCFGGGEYGLLRVKNSFPTKIILHFQKKFPKFVVLSYTIIIV